MAIYNNRNIINTNSYNKLRRWKYEELFETSMEEYRVMVI
jgi:hypothetical protein